MAFTAYTGTSSAGDLQYIINEIYSPKVEREFEANLLAADFFKDSSGMFAGGGDKLNIPDVYTNTYEAQDKVTSSNVTEQSPAGGNTTLSIDTWKEVSFLIEDRQLQLTLQSSDFLAALAAQARYTVAKALDTSILALYSGLSQTVNDTASDVEDADIRSAIKNIVEEDVPFDELAFMFHSTVTWDDLMGVSKYTEVYDSDPVAKGMFGGVSAKRKRAFRGTLYGVPVFETTNIQEDGASSAFYNMLVSPRAFTFAVRTPGSSKVRSQANYIPQQLGTLWTNDCLYGVAELRDLAGCVIKSRQSGIVS